MLHTQATDHKIYTINYSLNILARPVISDHLIIPDYNQNSCIDR